MSLLDSIRSLNEVIDEVDRELDTYIGMVRDHEQMYKDMFDDVDYDNDQGVVKWFKVSS